jgi:Leucine-rich repeat (LRR) protein
VTYLSTLVSDPAALLDTTSAQSLAVSWLANEDPLQLDPTVLSPENQLRIRQRYALTTLYFSTKESWRQDSNWLNGDECLWFGVTCYPADSPDLGPQTVLALELENNLLTDTLPADLGLLTDMTILNLAGNAITGTIPTQIADLSALEQLDLRKNALSGEIPALGGLVNLSILNLNQQEVGLTGPIPTSLGLLVNLVECRLHGNQLRGTIPSEIANMSQLTLLNILSNALTGQVPSALGNLAALENFYLSENQITGAVPSDLCAIASLAEMEVDCTVSCDCCIDCVGEDGSI